jgi:DNA-directed RNA polymerase specialized sigma24 family protein
VKNNASAPVIERDAALASFFELYYRDLLAYVTRKLGSTVGAADIVHEVYLRVRRLPSFFTVKNPQAYLLRMIANLTIDHQRRPFPEIPLLGSTFPQRSGLLSRLFSQCSSAATGGQQHGEQRENRLFQYVLDEYAGQRLAKNFSSPSGNLAVVSMLHG